MATMDVKNLQKELEGKQENTQDGTIEGTVGGFRIRTKAKRRISLIVGGDRSGRRTYVRDYAHEESDGGCYAISVNGASEQVRANFKIIEAPIDLAGAIRNLSSDATITMVDNLTDWMVNLRKANAVEGSVEALLSALHDSSCHILIVTKELGDCPDLSFAELVGKMNQKVALLSDDVIMMVCGIPVAIKGNLL